MRILRAAVAAAAFVALCSCRGDFGVPAAGASDPENADITIGELKALYRGHTVTITEPLTIAGRVTSSDRAGNFRYSFMVEQDGAAVEVMARLTDLHNTYPTGSRVAVDLQGLAIGERMGVICVGMPAEEYDYYPVDYIWSRVELDRRISRTHDPEPFGIPGYYVSMLERGMCGRIVRVVSLQRAAGVQDDEQSTTPSVPPVWGGYTIFEDPSEEGGRIAVYVSDYANFADRPVSESVTAVTGILQYGRPDGSAEDMFILKPRDEHDFLPY